MEPILDPGARPVGEERRSFASGVETDWAYAISAGSNFVLRMNHRKMTAPVAAKPTRLRFRIG